MTLPPTRSLPLLTGETSRNVRFSKWPGVHVGAEWAGTIPSLFPAGHILKLPTLVPEDIENPLWEDRKEKGLGHTLARPQGT